MLKNITIKHCNDCNEDRPFEHIVCSECGSVLALASKPNPEYITDYSIKYVCSQCHRENIEDHTGKFCPIKGGEYQVAKVQEEIILKGGLKQDSGFKQDSEYPFGQTLTSD